MYAGTSVASLIHPRIDGPGEQQKAQGEVGGRHQDISSALPESLDAVVRELRSRANVGFLMLRERPQLGSAPVSGHLAD